MPDNGMAWLKATSIQPLIHCLLGAYPFLIGKTRSVSLSQGGTFFGNHYIPNWNKKGYREVRF